MLAMRRAVDGLRLMPAQRAGRRQPPAGAADAGRTPSSSGDAKVRRSRPRRSWPRCTATACACDLHEQLSALRLRQPQGLPDAGTPGGAARARRLRGAPAQLRAGAQAVLLSGVIGDVMEAAARSARATTRCCCALRKLAQGPGAPTARLGRSGWKATTCCARCAARGWACAGGADREAAWQRPALRELAAQAHAASLRVPDALFSELSPLQSPAAIGCVDRHSCGGADRSATVATVVLDRLQDAGNVGSILRSAAALGVRQVLALHGTAALWSPKVLRAGMGAHFGLQLASKACTSTTWARCSCRWIATSSHAGAALHEARAAAALRLGVRP